MRLFGRVLVLAAVLCGLLPSAAGAAPIVLDPPDCTAVLGRTNSNCTLYDLGAISGLATFNLTFASDLDVALFAVSTVGPTTFFAETSSTGSSFPFLGLFNSDDERTLYSYTDLVDGELFAQGFNSLSAIPLAGDSVYFLAVLLHPNGFGDVPTSLREPFACEEGFPNDCTGDSANFALSLQATSSPQPVPEPGTLALLGSGALAALARRRSTKRNQRKNASRS